MVQTLLAGAASQANRDRIKADQVIGITCFWSDYVQFYTIPEAKQDSEKMQALFQRDMHLPPIRIIQLQNPKKTDFDNALERVKGLACNGKNTLLFLHYAGHGICNGGYVGLFGDNCFVNFTTDLSKRFELCPNIWVVMAFDACLNRLPADMRMEEDGSTPGGSLKI